MQDHSVDSRLLRSVAKGLSQICPRHERRPAQLEPAVGLNPNWTLIGQLVTPVDVGNDTQSSIHYSDQPVLMYDRSRAREALQKH